MIYAMWLFMMLTLIVLVIGLVGFARDNKFYQKNANKLMRLRILFQVIALFFAMLLIFMVQSGRS